MRASRRIARHTAATSRPAALAVDHDELDRAATVRRRQGGIDVGAREHGVTGCAQPRLHLRLDRADDEHRGGSPPD